MSTLANPETNEFSAWETCLDELEAGCARMASMLLLDLQLQQQDLARWEPPAHLGQMPASLGPRALQLSAQLGDLKAAYEQRQSDVAAQLQAVSSVPRPEEAPAIYLDQTG
ncbi:hypothetical protein [Glutamicibacter nicotianae]|uniref:hypothetical protein n=1 Tax=Glutamicibacter nicotianae TaxID=37929 RepID=UPI000EF90CD1|nr:hypothetical protein [Glutamicibacter nicotianae]